MKKICYIAIVLLLLSMIGAGCKGKEKDTTFEYEAVAGSIYVHSGGAVTAAYVEKFDKKYYSVDEVTKAGQNEVAAYNKANGGKELYSNENLSKEDKEANITLPVSLDSVTEKDQSLTVVLTYASAEHYMKFNEYDMEQVGAEDLFSGTVSQYADSLSDVKFVVAVGENSSQAVTIETIKEQYADYTILCVDYATKITCERPLAVVSSNVSLSSQNECKTQDDAVSYIIFK